MIARHNRLAALVFAVLFSACSGSPEKSTQNQQYAETPAKINAELGLGYMQQGDYKRAMQKLELALNYNPEYDKAHHYIAELYRRLNESKLADKHFQKAIELSPQDPGLRNNYGAFLCERGDFEQAEEQFLLAIRDPLYDGRVQAYENLGLCATQAGDLEKAEKYLRTALKANPRLVKSLYGMAELNYKIGDYLRARAYLQRYEEVGTITAESLWLGIRIEHRMGDREVMKRYARELSRLYPDSEQWHSYTSEGWYQ
ncbi:MAG: type IV pilus biogenesis/stability protein PilW [Gammaproteobacteria bacterium]|nr:type IV pilus biogenesis/stability protein PilW [Gammaproteobacteria bacterium]